MTRRRRVLRLLGQILIALVVGLALLNGAVRVSGGAPGLLSPLYLEEKVSGLVRLGAHLAREPWSPCPHARAERLLAEAARRHGVPVELAIAVGRAESDLRPHQVSATGAMGLMQLMPGTARELRVRDPFDVEQSIDGGVRYLARLLRRYDGDRARAVAAYNAGPAAVARTGALDLPSETRAYLVRVGRAARL